VDDVRIWSIFNADDRLVIAISDEPGEFNFTKIPDEDAEIIECDFATIQCYLSEVEPDALNVLFGSKNLKDFLKRLAKKGYKIREGRPQPRKFARL
jgi:hypothetical protein